MLGTLTLEYAKVKRAFWIQICFRHSYANHVPFHRGELAIALFFFQNGITRSKVSYLGCVEANYVIWAEFYLSILYALIVFWLWRKIWFIAFVRVTEMWIFFLGKCDNRVKSASCLHMEGFRLYIVKFCL